MTPSPSLALLSAHEPQQRPASAPTPRATAELSVLRRVRTADRRASLREVAAEARLHRRGVREIVPGDGSKPIIQRGGPFSKTLKIVCRPCNNEWMSGMETAAEPLLTAMFNARGTSVRLDEAAQLTLARWAFKTAAVISRIDYSDPFPLAHRREFHQADQPPRHVQVRIGAASVPVQAMGEQLAESRFEPRTATVTAAGRAASFPFYRATFRLITVVFDILGYVTDDYEMDISPDDNLKRAFLPLWPAEHPSIWWPPVTSLDIIGGVPGLITTSQFVGIPMLIPGNRG
jgi:hypothetical protein